MLADWSLYLQLREVVIVSRLISSSDDKHMTSISTVCIISSQYYNMFSLFMITCRCNVLYRSIDAPVKLVSGTVHVLRQ